MVEVLMAIRNNNMRKIPNYDPSHLEHLKKLLRSYTSGKMNDRTNCANFTCLPFIIYSSYDVTCNKC